MNNKALKMNLINIINYCEMKEKASRLKRK